MSAHDQVRTAFFNHLGLLYSAIVDADTAVRTVFGQQESAEIGHNPKYRGTRSYAPIVSGEGG